MTDSQNSDIFGVAQNSSMSDSQVRSLLHTAEDSPLPFLSQTDLFNGQPGQGSLNFGTTNNNSMPRPNTRSSRSSFRYFDGGTIGITHELYDVEAIPVSSEHLMQQVESFMMQQSPFPMNVGYSAYDQPTTSGHPPPREPPLAVEETPRTPPPIIREKFAVRVDPQDKKTNWDYLTANGCVFAKHKTAVPFAFTYDGGEVFPVGYQIRFYMQFSAPEHSATPVFRCPLHKQLDPEPISLYVPKCTLPNIFYENDRFSLRLPATPMLPVSYECFNSCAGGIDRRTTRMVFELLDQANNVVETATIGIRISANPARDAAPKRGAATRSTIQVYDEETQQIEENYGQKKLRKRPGAMVVSTATKIERRLEAIRNRNEAQEMAVVKEEPPPNAPPIPRIQEMMDDGRDATAGASATPPPISSNESVIVTESYGPNNITADEDAVYEVQIRGLHKYRAVMEILALYEKAERYVGLKTEMKSDGVVVSPLRDVSKMNRDTSIECWLSFEGIQLQHYVELFHSRGLRTLSDVMKVYTKDFFEHTLGIRSADASVLNTVYLNWSNVYKMDQLAAGRRPGAGPSTAANSQTSVIGGGGGCQNGAAFYSNMTGPPPGIARERSIMRVRKTTIHATRTGVGL